jgi:hypothetical protein
MRGEPWIEDGIRRPEMWALPHGMVWFALYRFQGEVTLVPFPLFEYEQQLKRTFFM